MGVKNPYQYFSNYVLRVPLFSIDFFKSITKNKITTEEELKKICKDKRIQEAIFLASPDLYQEFIKWLNNKLNSEKSERMSYAVLKYLSRMSSRCTPFGLFAGTTVGELKNETVIKLHPNQYNKRHTRLDMNYLVALSQDIVKIKSIRAQLKFYPNSSLYKIGRQFRYVEYSYVNTKRVHHIMGVNYTRYLDKIINASKEGKTVQQLAEILIDKEINSNEACAFIEKLIDSQLLISELEPAVSGSEFLDYMLNILKKIKHTEALVHTLEKVDISLKKIDKTIGNTISKYIKISELLKPLGTEFELKHLFQTDMIVSSEKNTISFKHLRKIKNTLRLLNKISFAQKENAITQFRKSFYERYETKPVPLSKALDKELGIGFLQNQDYGDVSALIDDLILPNQPNKAKEYKISVNIIQDVLQKKLLESIQSKSEIITIQDSDFNDLEENWNDLPDTMSSMIELVNIEGEERIVMNYMGGSSAVNLLGRFCHGDKNIEKHVREIIDVENHINRGKILAEIVHLPESRIGNILFRPHLRDFEIPYLANSTIQKENQITIDNLYIQAKSPNHLIIMSKKHNKEVIPRLSNAHNYSSGALPVYQFLANTQNMNKRNGIGFNWNESFQRFPFLPRVEYNGIILSYKLWNLTKKDIEPLYSNIEDNSKFESVLSDFLIIKKIPQFVTLKEGDNELLINFQNLLSVKMLLNTVKKKTKFQLKEFLHSKNGIVMENKNMYANQIVVSYYNEEKLKSVI